ncbi:MAG: hypothetical protein NTZ97_01010 [Candidatus Moranbacteria bacterium]|nr:hypothetical protein [Candidatus Moranbacteria bacterium]
MTKVLCKTCKKEFYAKPSWIKNGFGKYCSRVCHYKSARNGKEIICFICGKVAYKSLKALKRSKSKKFFCGKSCQTIWRNSIVNIGVNHPNWKGGKHVSYRNILNKNNIRKICLLCKNTDERVLAAHHVDGNHRNNKLKNLSWLCHNCHSLVHNHKKEKERFLETVKSYLQTD